MCGIAGMAGTRNADLLDKMLEITRHRGPDDWGTYLSSGNAPDQSVAIGNNRLKILDLSSAGHQPMASPDGNIWVVYNGELFNFHELREELLADGCVFRSHADTEVLPYLWLKYGPEMVQHLNGMFAFAIWDTRDHTLFIARDRMGVKPLYYTLQGSKLYFASEIKAILLAPDICPELDIASLRSFLSLLYVPHPDTMFRNIRKLQPGHSLIWKKGKIQIERYWDNSKPAGLLPGNERDLTQQCREVLKDAVRRQLVSDVPVGFFLSGGLDSSTLLACAAEVHSGPLRCYTIAFREEHARLEQCGEDPFYARKVAQHFGAECHEIVVDPDVTSLLPKAIWHLDDAIADHAAIATWLICKEARANVTVLLSGQGGDELFAGYRVHLVEKFPSWIRTLPRPVREKFLLAALQTISKNTSRVPGLQPGLVMAYCRYLTRVLKLIDLPPAGQFIGMRSYLRTDELQELLNPDIFAISKPYEEILQEHFDEAASLDFLEQMLYVDQQTFLPDLNLAYSDKLSMAASIEARVPFLDNAVVDFMRRVPSHLKLHGHIQKYILKKAMEGVLPRDVIYRRKAGFSLPVRSWLRSELSEMLGDVLSEKRVRERGLFRPGRVAKMIEDNRTGQRDYTLQLWSLLTLELWQQTFIDASRPCLTA
ncbi:MAG TPA: asparagine synthase (glutamine-hydrolyzing) [Pseudacidobacterium sp.]|nr:asparagine synthase (glutamine-hydrolyzing) [Pseudacidobacterium sp.]